MTKPAILVHPPLPMFEPQLSLYDVAHWPTERKDIAAAVTIGSHGLSNEMIQALPNLKAIVCFGVGVDGLDVDFCAKSGVAIAHGRDINHEDVADVAMGLMIAVSRSFSQGERVLRDNQWRPPLAVPPQRRFSGRKLGIVGMGAIGQAIARRAQGFGHDIRWTGPSAKPDIAFAYEPDLIALARWADILAVAPRGDKSTEGLISAAAIKALGPDGILVNVSRGSVVDEDALIAALKSGDLGGAGLDVFAQEPTPAERWKDAPNVTLTPHLGGGTREALMAGAVNVLDNLRRHFAGEVLATPLR